MEKWALLVSYNWDNCRKEAWKILASIVIQTHVSQVVLECLLQIVLKSHRLRVMQILVGSGCSVVESDKDLIKYFMFEKWSFQVSCTLSSVFFSAISLKSASQHLVDITIYFLTVFHVNSYLWPICFLQHMLKQWLVFFISVRSGVKQLSSIINFLLSIIATFTFGYIASKYAFPSVAVVCNF